MSHCWCCFNHISYTDDMVILTSSAKALQMLLNICYDFVSLDDVVYNSTKTVCMIFRSRSFKDFNAQKFILNGCGLEFTEEVEYLSHIINNTLKDDTDMRNQLKKIKNVGNVLIRKFGSCKREVKWTLFRRYCSMVYSG